MTEDQAELIDDRPLAEPTFFSYAAPGDFASVAEWVESLRETWGDKVAWQRFTIINDEPPCPDGWYFEGWAIKPWKMDPPHKEAPFNYPLTATPGDPQ